MTESLQDCKHDVPLPVGRRLATSMFTVLTLLITSCGGTEASACADCAADVAEAMQVYLDDMENLSTEDALAIMDSGGPESFGTLIGLVEDTDRWAGERNEPEMNGLIISEGQTLNAQGPWAFEFKNSWLALLAEDASIDVPPTESDLNGASSTTVGISAPVEEAGDAYIVGLGPATYWDFEYSRIEFNDDQFAGTFRIELGSPTEEIDGVIMYPLSVTSTGGDRPPFTVTRFQYIGSSEAGLFGSTDGVSREFILSPVETNWSCPSGFWLDDEIAMMSGCQFRDGDEIRISRERETFPGVQRGTVQRRDGVIVTHTTSISRVCLFATRVPTTCPLRTTASMRRRSSILSRRHACESSAIHFGGCGRPCSSDQRISTLEERRSGIMTRSSQSAYEGGE